MFEDSKVVFITHPYYAVNNPTNNLRIYKKAKNSDNWRYIQCKSKEEYRTKLNEYITGFYEYSRDKDKAHASIKSFSKTKSDSLFDYFMGGKKTEEIMKENQMKREEIAMLKDGTFLKDKDVPSMQKRWCKYAENSNIQMTVLSFYQNYIDENINIKELQKKIATDVIPKFLSYSGYENPKENLEWIVALHSDRENNYHFHISWIEKNKCYKNKNGKLEHRIRLKITDEERNFLKRQATLTIERKRLYTPTLIKLEKDFEELKSYFNPKDQNFTLKNVSDLELEEKIVRLGFLLNEIRGTDKKYIKYNSLPKDEIGNKIRILTKEIKKEIFKDKRIKEAKKDIYMTIDKINNILLDIDKRNNISNLGFESAIENKMIKEKLDKNDTYVYNAIVNHALYNYNYYSNKIKKNNFSVEDIINQVAYENYKKEIQVVMRYVNVHYKEHITLDQIAEEANLNKSYLCRLFKKEYGDSVFNYLNMIRMEKAAELLRSNPGLYVQEAAAEVGITEPFYFTRRFKEYFGISPREYILRVSDNDHSPEA